jgi:hypothetical protein
MDLKKSQKVLVIVHKLPSGNKAEHPPDILNSLIDCSLPLATKEELGEHQELRDTLAVDIKQVVASLKDRGKTRFLKYWEQYSAKHPNYFLTFEIDEVKIVY